ncbi:MAG: glycosyl hydrolase family 18 protein [bacterium]|nr:glycosyl hydrolase family 18 protein [bacterium]
MREKIFIIIISLSIGLCSGYFGMKYIMPSHQVIGFLPYWLTSKGDKNYSKYITTLTYFGLNVGVDGKIVKFNAPGEEEPGWYTLRSGKVDTFLKNAKKDHINLSLLIFSGDEATISALLSNPTSHAKNLVEEVGPIMQKYGFKDLNLDIESVSVASQEARKKFTTFVKEVKKNMDKQRLGTLTIDVSPTALIKPYLISVTEISKIVDHIIFMMYDFHYTGSLVTGAVSPIGGAGINAEFDTETGVKEALRIMPSQKILLGTPLYGYEWETLGNTPHSAVMPSSGLTDSNRRAEEFITSCSSCSAQIDPEAKESYVIYKDQQTGTYHQMFYPDEQATLEKISLANKYKLGGVAVWALGYDGKTILNPLEKYKNSFE